MRKIILDVVIFALLFLSLAYWYEKNVDTYFLVATTVLVVFFVVAKVVGYLRGIK